MPVAIFALAAINFAVGTQSFSFAGLLEAMAHDLDVPLGRTGWLIAASSLTFAVGSPFAAMLVASRERRRVILVSLFALAAANALSALASSFAALLLLRVVAGIATAFTGSLATIAAAQLVPPQLRGRAFAIVLGGLTVAFVLGVPIGSLVGSVWGWRATFVFSAAIVVFACVLIAIFVPRLPGQAGSPPEWSAVAGNRKLLQILALTLVGFTATFTIVAFIGPVITRASGSSGATIGLLQGFIGIGSILGLAAGGALADRGASGTGTSAAFAVMAVSLGLYTLALSDLTGRWPNYALAAQITIGAAALFALVPMNLAAIARSAGPATPLALALNGSLVSFGQGLGALIGGTLTSSFGAPSMGIGAALLALSGLALSRIRMG